MPCFIHLYLNPSKRKYLFLTRTIAQMDPWPIATLGLIFLATDALICLTWFAERREPFEPAKG